MRQATRNIFRGLNEKGRERNPDKASGNKLTKKVTIVRDIGFCN
jgi:hypothetical protein